MAEKSAHIDATLRMAGLSEVFTQDIEDMMQRREAENIEQPDIEPDSVPQRITEDQHRQLEARIEELGLDPDRVKTWMIKASKKRFSSFEELDPEFYQVLYRKLDQFARVTQ